MKIGDKVVFRKLADNERTGRIVGFSEDGKGVAVSTLFDTFIVHPNPFEDIVVIEEKMTFDDIVQIALLALGLLLIFMLVEMVERRNK